MKSQTTMKIINGIMVVAIFAMMQACGEKPQESLDTLLANRAELDEKIEKLQSQDTVSKNKGKTKFVEVREVQTESFSHFIEVQGVADTDKNILLTAKTGGTVEVVYVKEGDAVKKGQLLVRLDDNIILNSMAEVRTSLAFATELFEKQKSLWEQKIGSEVQYLQAKNNKESLEGRLSTLREQLSMTKVTSPISGIVENVNIKQGELAAPGMPLVQVVNLSEFEIKATVAENYSMAIKNGTSVKLYFPDLKEEIDSEISFVGNVIDPINRTFNVVIRLKNPNIPIKPNMIVVVKVQDFTEEAGIVVPLNVIQSSDQGKYVYVASDENGVQVAKKRSVVTEINYNGMALIKEGLSANEKIVTFGFQDLSDGQMISF
ncbi:MAG: efflux RND transporter periplasmic adaptor subunit [Cyclobacteriaceae bacterium]|nr:efflux RND transporter periplasmic adaptor subunit [Cyclobacteriaceae bacterium]